ncbi:hypothetical protein E1B28_005237 [Marasmius oreades]|uniref:Uncharacterized protein n=1 Tax=Marasmius oreades TaxID=181124 RepID=A0A9P7V0D2_9AGAR|nr:uncharacterized protein E1B28_005237 [Marasmius oreades]KAG7097927.1 hypothetical protein E1B28_005237 [Marasmius oreades]
MKAIQYREAHREHSVILCLLSQGTHPKPSDLPDELFDAAYGFLLMIVRASHSATDLQLRRRLKIDGMLDEKDNKELEILESIDFVRQLATSKDVDSMRENLGGNGHVQHIIQRLDWLQTTTTQPQAPTPQVP